MAGDLDESIRRALAEANAASCLLDAHPPHVSAAALHIARARFYLSKQDVSFDAFLDALVPEELKRAALHDGPIGAGGEEVVMRELAAVHVDVRAAAGESTSLLGTLVARARRHWLASLTGVAVLVGVASLHGETRRSSPWKVSYFPSVDLTGPPVVTTIAGVDEVWRAAGPPQLEREDYFSARYETCLVVTGIVFLQFELKSDDGSKLLVDDQLVIDNWSSHSTIVKYASKTLTEGVHRIVVEYFEETGGANVTFKLGIGEANRPTLTIPGLKRCKT